MFKYTAFALVLFVSPDSYRHTHLEPQHKPSKVVAIALDGVREVEAKEYLDSLLPGINKRFGFRSYWFGDTQGCTTSQKHNISLPAYASVLTGVVDPTITTNSLKRLNHITLFDIYGGELYTMWRPLRELISRDQELITNLAKIPLHVDNVSEDEMVFESIKHISIDSSFVLVHYTDADNAAHSRSMSRYIKFAKLEAELSIDTIHFVEKLYKSITTYIIFSDHSRGLAHNWHSHGPNLKGSEKIWFVVISPISLEFSLEKCDHIAINKLIKSFIP